MQSAKAKLILFLLAIAIGSYWLWGSSAEDSGKKKKKTLEVTVASGVAHKGNIDEYVNALGSVNPHNTVTVRSRVDGELLKIHFTEGQWVNKGDLLAEIDPRTYQAQLTQAQGQKMRDEASLQEARQTLERYKSLFAKDAIPRQQLDTQASLVKQLEGTVKNDQGLIDNATTQVDYTRITAPISGRVGLKQVDPGNIVHASDSTGIVVITELDPISVLFTVPEDRIPTLMKQMQEKGELSVEAWNRENTTQLATGKLVAMDNQVDANTGTLKLRADFSNEKNMLFPNQFVNVRLKLATRQDELLIPSAALQRGAKGMFVYRIKGDRTVEIANVTVNLTQGEMAAVGSGLSEGDQVVTEGADSLRDGASVILSDGTKTKTREGNDTNASPTSSDKKPPHTPQP